MESKCSLQVPLLLKLGESKRALMSATKSGDTDLIYTVLLQLKETTQLADFQMIVRTFPTAQNLYKKYCNLNSKSALQEIFNQEDDFVAQAEFALREGIAVNWQFFNFLTNKTNFITLTRTIFIAFFFVSNKKKTISLEQNSSIEASLLTASVAYKKAHKDVEAELCEDSRKLLKDQKSFADK